MSSLSPFLLEIRIFHRKKSYNNIKFFLFSHFIIRWSKAGACRICGEWSGAPQRNVRCYNARETQHHPGQVTLPVPVYTDLAELIIGSVWYFLFSKHLQQTLQRTFLQFWLFRNSLLQRLTMIRKWLRHKLESWHCITGTQRQSLCWSVTLSNIWRISVTSWPVSSHL